MPVHGAQIWRHVVNLGGPTYNNGAYLGRDDAGNLIVASHQRERYREFTGFVAKLTADGIPIWSTGATGDGFFAVAIDSNGDALAAGAISGPDPNDEDLVVVKFSGVSGAEIWRYVLNGALNEGDQARAIDVDSNGDAFVGGWLKDNVLPGIPDFLVLKLSGVDGAELWRNTIPSINPHGGEVASLALDESGDVIAGGHAVLIGWCDFVVAKFSGASGQELWRAVEDDGGGCDSALSVALDPSGDVLASGSMGPTVFTVMKFSGGSGQRLWRRDLPNVSCSGGGCAKANSVRIDSLGNALATGAVGGSGEIAIAKLAPTDGAELWAKHLDVDGCGDVGHVVSVDQEDDVVVGASAFARVAGECDWPNGGQYAVLKLTGASGRDFWEPCQDERDNDGDGRIDFDPATSASPGDADTDPAGQGDPGCKSPTWSWENPLCQDGVDNDDDGKIDYDAGRSIHGLGDANGPDPQCEGTGASAPWAWRNRESNRGGCGLGFELALVLTPFMLLGRRRLA